MLTPLRESFAYNRWANERLLDACASLSPEQIKRELGGSYPSIWATLTHIYGADTMWLSRWEGNPAGAPPDLDGVDDLAALREKWDALWVRQSRLLDSLSEADVRRPLAIIMRSGKRLEQQLAATMRHAVNHATYHRGQVTNFIRMLGGTAVALDLVLFYAEHPPAD